MTNKTVTMSRELAEKCLDGATSMGWSIAEPLRALLVDHVVPQPEWVVASQRAAPVVERQEPVQWQRKSKMHGDCWYPLQAEDIEYARSSGWEVRALYTSPPAPVAVVLPDRAAFEAWRDRRNASIAEHGGSSSWYVSQAHYATWEACLDKVKELNP